MGKLTFRSPTVRFIVLLLVLIPITFFIVQTDFSEVGKELKGIGYRFIYLLFVTFAAYLFGTLSWQACLGKYQTNVSLFQLFAIRQVGETVGLYNPTSIIGGDLLKSKFLTYYHIPPTVTLRSVIISRCTAVLSQLLLFLLAVLWLLFSPYSAYILSFTGDYIYLFLGLSILLKAVFVLWLFHPGDQPAPLPAPTSWLSRHLHAVKDTLSSIRVHIQSDVRAFWRSYIYAAVHWIIGSIEFYLILRFLDYDMPIMSGLLLDMSVIVIKSFAAFVPGQIGIEEMANKLMLTVIGISGGTIWITVSILRRARQLVWIAFGFILFLFIKKDVRYATT